MSSNAGYPAPDEVDQFTITHPFHPRLGRQYTLVTRSKHWGEDRVSYYNEEGKFRSMRASWTSAAATDLFDQISAGHSWFRTDDLRELSSLVRDVGQRLEEV